MRSGTHANHTVSTSSRTLQDGLCYVPRQHLARAATLLWPTLQCSSRTGIVSALNPIIMGKGSRATLNVAVSDSQNRVRVDTTFAIPGLTGTSTSAVRDEFCSILREAFPS